MKLSTKLALGFGSLVLIAIILGATGYFGVSRNAVTIDIFQHHSLPTQEALLTMENSANIIKACQRTLLSLDMDPAARLRQYETAHTAWERMQKAEAFYASLAMDASEETAWRDYKETTKTWRSAADEAMKLAREYDDLIAPYAKTERSKTLPYPSAVMKAGNLCRDAEVQFKEQTQEWKNILLRGHVQADYDRYLAGFSEKEKIVTARLGELTGLVRDLSLDAAAIEKIASLHQELGAKYHGALKTADRAQSDWSRKVDTSLRGIDRPLTTAFSDLIAYIARAEENMGTRSRKLSEQVLATCRSAQLKVEAATEKLMALNSAEAEVIDKRASKESSFFVILALVATGIGVAAGCVLAWLLTRSIAGSIRGVVTTLVANAEQTACAAAQVSGASQSLAQGASEQAASLEETSASLEEMAGMTQRSAENAQRTKELAGQTRHEADTGLTDMRAMHEAMGSIKSSSDDIAKIIKTIDEIAFQTNILALNAAVEAARAGDAGAGFAVVAEEVRGLAQRAAQAAKETAGKIEGAIANTSKGVQLSERVAASLEKIAGRVRQVDEYILEIATAASEQSQGIKQVTTAVSEMDRVTQGNAANAEESASASEELNAQAEMMREAMGQLQILVEGAARRGQVGLPVEKPKKISHRTTNLRETAPRQHTPALSHAFSPPVRDRGEHLMAQHGRGGILEAAGGANHGGKNGNGVSAGSRNGHGHDSFFK